MNNSKLSVVTLLENRFTATHPHASRSPRSTVGRSQTTSSFNNTARSDNGVIEADGVDELTCIDIQTGRAVADEPCSRVKQPDLGVWLLLSGSADRQDRWERLRTPLPGDVGSRRCGLEYSSGLVKRICDVIGALFLLVVLFPIFILIAIVIKIDSPGPVLFRHYRVGKNGNPFLIWKFRSMRTDVPAYEPSPRSVVDGRLTRVGRIIRRLSFDEIPQLINVLRGEMSLVGPRPEMPFIVARYHPLECERLTAKPGITGLWQISPARAFPIHENLEYDLHYIRNQNLFLDCAIVLRTLAAVIRGVGAV